MDYEEIKRQKMEELKQRQLKEQQRDEREAKIATVTRSLLEEKAMERLNNVKIVNKELYLKVIQLVLYLQRAGQLQGKIGDEELKQLLEKIRNKKEIKITRK